MMTEKQRTQKREYIRKYRAINNNWRVKERERVRRVRKLVIDYYSQGTNKCKKCGFNDLRALTIDHINNDGKIHRRGLKQSSIYFWLRANEFPVGFQVLCWNCNWIKKCEYEKTKS